MNVRNVSGYLVAGCLAVACATSVSSDEIKRLCATGQCGNREGPADSGVGNGGVETGGTGIGGTSSGGATGGAGASNGGVLSSAGTSQGGTHAGGVGGGGASAGGGVSAGGAAAGAGGTSAAAGGTTAQGGTGGITAMAGSSGSGGVAASGGAGGTGGNGGTGGSGGAAVCPAKTTWTATSSQYCGSAGACSDPNGPFPPSLAIDASIATRFSSGQPQAGTEWLQIDFGVSVSLDSVTIDTEATNPDDYGRQYEIRMSNTSGDMAAAIAAQGAGMTGAKVFAFAATATGRYLLISQKGVYAASWWSVHDINVVCH